MSWMGVMLGSLAIFGIILSLGVVVAILLAASGTAGATGGGTSSLVGVSLTLLLAFFLGGYVAGRTASRHRVSHDLPTALLALVAVVLLIAVGAIFGSGLVNGLSGLRLPSNLEDVQNLGTTMTVSGVLALILPFIGGAWGGARGAKMNRRRRS
jgi:hypothetical protein